MPRSSSYDQLARDELAGLSGRWGWFLAFGVVLVLASIAAFGSVVLATLATVFFLGSLLFVGGVIETTSAFTSRRWRGFGIPLVSGLLIAILGIMLMVRPSVGAGVLTLLLALALAGGGTARVFYAVAERFPGWGWQLASGIGSVLLAVIVFSQFPISAFWLLGVAIAVELLFRGVSWIVLAFIVRGIRPALASPAQPSASATAAASAP